MNKILFTFFSLCLLQPALAAKSKSFQYKVESDSPDKESKNNKSYPYDSLEKQNKRVTFKEVGFWPNKSNLAVGAGFLADEEFWDQDKTNRWFASVHFTFRNRSWHRFIAGGQLIQNNTFMVDTSWHYIPSRKKWRDYYGFGLAHLLYSEDEFRSILVTGNYFVTASYGVELLQENQKGFRAEAKAYLGSGTYALQILVSYILHL